MSYILLALFALVFSSLSTVADKFIVSSWFDSPLSAAFAASIPKSLIAGTIPIYLRPSIGLEFFSFAFLASMLYTISFAISFTVLQKRDVTKLQPLAALSNVFVILISFLFFGSRISFTGYLGIVLITLGAFVALLVRVEGEFDFSSTTAFYLLGVLFAAFFSVISDLGVSKGSPLIFYAIYDGLSAFMLSPLLLREEIRSEVRTFFTGDNCLEFFGLKSLAPVSLILYFISLSKGPVEIVASIFTLSSVGVLIIIWVLSELGYSYDKRLGKSSLLKKMLAVILSVIGLIVLRIAV